MDKNMYYQITQELQEEAALLGIEVSDAQAELLIQHLKLVIEKNKVMNLTRITDPMDGVVLHVIDSLLPLLALQSVGGSFLDIGTGAGFPGIPLGIMTNTHGMLIDSVGKKVRAVAEFIQQLGLEDRLETQTIRAEDLAREGALFDHVVARAVAQTNVLIEYASPLLRPHCKLLVCKANPTQEELDHAWAAADICGMAFVSRETFELPHGLGHREILTFEKIRKPSIRLPRRTGLAKSEPLGE